MPKVELHVHLEGSIQPATLFELAERNGVHLPARNLEDLASFYRFRDFPHFIEVYVTVTSCLRTIKDYQLIAYQFGVQCAQQNIRYAEVTFTIATNMRLSGLSWQEILGGLNAGRAQAQQEFGVLWNWIFDISRDNPDTQDAVVEIALAARDQGVVALGLGGSEADFPPELFSRAFTRALQGDIGRVPHAGETAGPASIWDALKLLHAQRIGHGVRAIEDSRLIEVLQQQRIPLEICPTSNLRLGVYPDYATHPLRRLWDAGLLITIGSDDPPLFGADLNHEYQVLIDHFGFSAAELEQVSLNGLEVSFLDEVEKARLKADFLAEYQRLSKTL